MARSGRWQSIERQLPLLFSGLLLFVVAALALGASREMRRLSLEIARTRLDGLTTQLANSSSEQSRRRLLAADSIARGDVLTRALREPTSANRAAALALLREYTRDTTQILGALLSDSTGERVLTVGAPPPPSTNLGATDTAATTGPLIANGDQIAYAISAPVRVGRRAIGRVVQWRRVVSTNPRAREQISQIVGLGAEITFGNADGSLWVDLDAKVAPSVAALREARGVVEFERPGAGTRIGAARPVPFTPWLIAVEFPRSVVLAPANTFLNRLAIISAPLLLLSLLAGWLITRRISRPLRDVTAAAEGIAAGDFTRELKVDRDDEVGRLAAAFTVMAEHVRGSQQRLEEQVATRTQELSETMRRLGAAQDELIRKERLAILGQLSSGVGHELRNPLGVMTNAVYYLDAVLRDAPANVKEYLGILRTQIAVSEKIVGDLLDYARVKTPQRGPVPLGKVIDDQLTNLKALNVRVIKELPEGASTAYADGVQVGQIVANLITNAFQSMESTGGTVTLRATTENGSVRLDVSDTGPGIAPEHMDLVFEPLFTTKARGIGLGLAVSRSLAAANGGALTVSSTPGRGATFTLVLPAAGDHQAA